MNSAESILHSPAQSARASRFARLFLLASGGLLLWLLAWIWLSWPYSLDDALIHLRYADHLLHQHMVTYDGVHRSFGTSSLLYVAVLAALRSVWTSPILPRVLSSLVYAGFFAGLIACIYRALRRYPGVPGAVWLMALALAAVFVTPSAVRWMDDGMETGWVFAAALLGILLLRRLLHGRRIGGSLQILLFLYGLLTVLLRVELLLLVGCISAMALLEAIREQRNSGQRAAHGRLLASALPLVGGLVAAALIVLTMHALLPDTAVAKAFGAARWDQTFRMTAITVASSFSFGIGLILVWIASFVALAVFARVTLADLAPNLLFPVVLLVSATRGQQIQGIRYFGWTLFFPALWNLLRTADEQRRPALAFDRVLRVLAILFFIALVPSVVWESATFHRIFTGRGSALDAFRAQQLDGLRGQLGIAEDVGFVGYFTQGDICDPYGLVNGRAAARLDYNQRFAHCMARHPVFAFGSDVFLHRVAHDQSLAGWAVCGDYRFDNVRTRDVHYLVVAPAQIGASCPATARPLSSVLPDLDSRG